MSPKQVGTDGRITEPGEYVLTDDRRIRDVTPPSEAMIRIESDDVTLDGRGHAVVGNGVSDTTGIAVAGDRTLTDVTVRNVSLAAWEFGLHLRDVGRATVRGVRAERNSYGLLFEDVTQTDIDDCTVRENLIGVTVEPGTAFNGTTNRVTDNQLENVLREPVRD